MRESLVDELRLSCYKLIIFFVSDRRKSEIICWSHERRGEDDIDILIDVIARMSCENWLWIAFRHNINIIIIHCKKMRRFFWNSDYRLKRVLVFYSSSCCPISKKGLKFSENILKYQSKNRAAMPVEAKNWDRVTTALVFIFCRGLQSFIIFISLRHAENTSERAPNRR